MQYLNTSKARYGSETPWALSPDAKQPPQQFWWGSKKKHNLGISTTVRIINKFLSKSQKKLNLAIFNVITFDINKRNRRWMATVYVWDKFLGV